MMNRLICGCLRDRQALKHRRHTHQQEEAHAGVAHLSDDDEMAVAELPPLPTAPAVVYPPVSVVAAASKSKPEAMSKPQQVASTSKPAAAGEDGLLTGLRPSPPPVAATAPPQQPTSLQQQQHKSTPTKAGPAASAAPSPRSPAAPASPAPPSPAPSPRSPGPEEAASPSRLPSRTVHASPPPAPAPVPVVSSPSASIFTIKPPPAANANWAEAWAPMMRERQQADAQEKAKQEFVAALGKGIAALKHDRKGHARVRELYTPDGGQSFSWRSPHKEKAGHGRGKSSAGGGGGGAGVFERGRAIYAFHEILEVG